jgi:hypothetical protein
MDVKIIPLKQLKEHAKGQEVLVDVGVTYRGRKICIGSAGDVCRDIANAEAFVRRLEGLYFTTMGGQ